jgi:hypothetical protein
MPSSRLLEDMAGSPCFEDILYVEACKNKIESDSEIVGWFEGFEIWVYKVRQCEQPACKGRLTVGKGIEDGALMWKIRKPRLRSEDEIEYWVQQSPPFDSDTKSEFIGGLRLLVQKWPKQWPGSSAGDTNDSFVHKITKGNQLPFSKKTLKVMKEVLHLPPSYLHDFTGDYAVPLRLKWVEYETKDGIRTNLGSSCLLSM